MRSRYKAHTEGYYFVTSTIANWINIFSFKGFPEIIINEFKFRREKKQFELYAYVIMPEHIHMIIYSKDIVGFMRNFKSFTAKQIINKLKENKKYSVLDKLEEEKPDYKTRSQYQVWQEGFHPKLIWDSEEFIQKTNYIHFNPVKRGLVESPNEWIYSSYNFFYGDSYLLEMDY